jgi:hypothetical protein
MRLDIRTDFAGVQRKLDALQSEIRDKVLVRSLNRTIEGARTDMSREIRSEFNLSAVKVREKLRIRKAGFSRGQLRIEAVLSSVTQGGRRAINVINFQARQTPKGLTAKIKRNGGRVLISSKGFVANKGRTAFKRRGKSRLPIDPIQTIDVPQMFNTKRINEKVVRAIREKFPVIVGRETAFYISRFNRP